MPVPRFSRSDGRGKGRVHDAPLPQDALTYEFWHSYLKNFRRYALDMNTQTRRALRTGSLICYMSPFGCIKTVCHDRHETVTEFISILYEQMWMKIT